MSSSEIPIYPSQGSPWNVVFVAACLFLISVAVNLQAPLYSLYAAAGGYGAGLATAAFASYVAGLVPVLVMLGGLSDRIGRKAPLCAAMLMASAATLLLVFLPTLGAVAISRLMLGIAVGLMSGAGAALISELLPTDAAPNFCASIVAVSTSLGFGLGPLLTSLWPPVSATDIPVTYLVYLPCAAGGIALLGLVREKSAPRPSARWLRLPALPPTGIAFGIAIAVAWAASGAIISVIPLQLAKSGLSEWAGLVGFLVICPGLIGTWMGRRMPTRAAVVLGLLLAPLGYSATVAGVIWTNVELTLIGAGIAGVACYGLTYFGGLSATLQLACNEEKARASAAFFLFAYFGFSVPVVLLGSLGDLIGVARSLVISAFIIVSASVTTLIYILVRHPRDI